MLGWLFGRNKEPQVDALHAAIVAAARAQGVFRDEGVPDTFEGRFEYLALVATLVLERLKALGPGGDAVGQVLVDRIFTGLDDAVRRMGVSDIGVGKKVKKLAKSFYGRAEAYRSALHAGDEVALRAALSRNLYAGALAPEAVPPSLLARIAGLRAGLEHASLEALQAGAYPKDQGDKP